MARHGTEGEFQVSTTQGWDSPSSPASDFPSPVLYLCTCQVTPVHTGSAPTTPDGTPNFTRPQTASLATYEGVAVSSGQDGGTLGLTQPFGTLSTLRKLRL